MKKRLNHTAAFRKILGISQQELAEYLGISYSLLTMHEKGQRELPTKALIKFGQLLGAYEAAKKQQPVNWLPAALQEAVEKKQDQLHKKLTHQFFMDDKQVQLLKYELEQLQGRQQGTLTWLHLIDEKLLATENEYPAGDRKWLEQQRDKVNKLVLENVVALLQLPFRIALLEAYIAVYEKELPAAKPGGHNNG